MGELSGNNSNQRGQDEHYKNTKKVTVYYYDTSNDVPIRVSATNPLPTTASISGDVSVTGTAAYSDSGAVEKKGLVDADRHVQVDVLTSGLPTGASTSAKQDTGNTSLSSIDGKITAVNTGAVVVSSSALPSGAATAAKQPALGTAGTASADVITVQGKAAMTPILTDGSATTQPVSGTVTANTGLTQPLTDTQLRATPVPVSGTVTANLSATDNAALDDIAADTEAMKTSLAGTLTVTGGGGGVEYTEGDTDATIVGSAVMVEDAANTLQPLQGDKTNGLDVDVTRSALPSGASTSAKQDTMIGHLDGVEGLLTTIDGDTGTLSVVGSGTEANAQRVTIATDSTGVLSVDDNGSSLTVDGTVTANAGSGTMAVSNAGLTELEAAINSSKVDVNIASSAVASGGTSAADDADFTAGTTAGTPSMGVYESTPTSVTDGDLGTVGITSGRRLKTSATIDAAIPAGNNNIGDVDVASSALPTGASTSANQTTIIGHVDGIEGSVDGIETLIGTTNSTLTTIDGRVDGLETLVTSTNTKLDTANTSLGTLDNAIAGSEMQVDVVGALPAGTNAIGKLAANSGVDIGDVDVTSIATGTNAIGRVGHDITSIGHGVTTVTTAGTDVALAGSTACKEVTIQAQTDNTSSVAVGATGVDATVATGTGVLLGAGDSITLKCDNLADIYIDSLVSGEGVRYVYLT